MAQPSSESVLGDFSAGPIALADGQAQPGKRADGWVMNLQSAQGHEQRKVDLVLASGRQHQLYVTHGDDGSFSLLPLIWSTWTHEWIPTSLYQRSDLDPRSQGYWAKFDLTRGCFSCHLSQSYRRVDGAPASVWVDLSINCESCHGPGAEHVRRRRAGRSDEVYRDLRPLGGDEEARVCGQCHGFSLKPYVFPRAKDGLPEIFVTSLVNSGLRPDGTQRSTSYQYPGHVLSGCFRGGALTCKGCHSPHGLTARDFVGEPATGEQSNRQCTICHRDKLSVSEHSHHAAKIRCVDCHMSYSWIEDNERRKQRTSDHSISIPRPAESIELGTPNACTTCHSDRAAEWALSALRRWGATKAIEVRQWVRTIALGRRSAPGATERLAALLVDEESGRYLRASALDLLALQRPDAQLIPLLAPLAGDADPERRALAIRALQIHDAAHLAHWVQLGLADAHPYVRMETFSFCKDMSLLTPAAIDRDLADTLAYKNPPSDGLVHLITVRHRRGEIREALSLLELLDRYSLPSERARLDLDGVRARLRADLARH